ncbi:uncharacterized protein LY79DRAFT_36743 [Colletotrichum navitas]|uniref:Uncharacterized protein n=1 Tax=Colletotrichum navitas TaxID=681940 RepID=A0AAD8Q702_9PEZI|nr:uncharacterized protein LY79DRAFT_36743 [Colletotrichum navitas]KAK1596962.1 hypothetical protein LY79DRAFT_36743 [Colletotrichum navitas]
MPSCRITSFSLTSQSCVPSRLPASGVSHLSSSLSSLPPNQSLVPCLADISPRLNLSNHPFPTYLPYHPPILAPATSSSSGRPSQDERGLDHQHQRRPYAPRPNPPPDPYPINLSRPRITLAVYLLLPRTSEHTHKLHSLCHPPTYLHTYVARRHRRLSWPPGCTIIVAPKKTTLRPRDVTQLTPSRTTQSPLAIANCSLTLLDAIRTSSEPYLFRTVRPHRVASHCIASRRKPPSLMNRIRTPACCR